jgi:hypothetical protein
MSNDTPDVEIQREERKNTTGNGKIRSSKKRERE